MIWLDQLAFVASLTGDKEKARELAGLSSVVDVAGIAALTGAGYIPAPVAPLAIAAAPSIPAAHVESAELARRIARDLFP